MELSEEEYQLLREIQQNEKHKRNYVKVTVLLMLYLGESIEKISIFLGISTSTISNYRKFYESNGLAAYLATHYVGYSGKLNPTQQSLLKAEIKANVYSSSTSICTFIRSEFGISYTPNGLVPLLHQLGFSYKKTKLVPCEADKEKQEIFVETLNNLLEGLKSEESIYFADAVHPQHNTKSSYAWIEKGQEKEILSVSGRQRINLNAVINAQNPTELIMVEGKTINADNTWELYQKIEALHPEKEQIFIVCDNARYYKNKALNEKLAHSKIKQVFLPPYSPNLNLIERLWKLMRKKVINHQFYRKFDEFKASIFHFFEHIEEYKQELESLMAWNFHIPKSKTNFY